MSVRRSIVLGIMLGCLHPEWGRAAVSVSGWLQHNPESISASTIPGLQTLTGDDANATADVTLPFEVVIGGTAYGRLTISANGWIEFGGNTAPQNDSSPVNMCLPTSLHTNPFLAAYWDNLQTVGTAIRYGTIGAQPNRVFVADFVLDRVGTDAAVANIAFQVQVHEQSNLISVRYRDAGGFSTTVGGSATIGFQGAGGAIAQAQALTCNGVVLDESPLHQGWSVDASRADQPVLAAELRADPTGIPASQRLMGKDATIGVDLPFAVIIEGAPYTRLALSTNGWMEFGGNSAGDTDKDNTSLPTSKHANPFLAGYWDDMETVGSGVRWNVEGSDPNRTFVADFDLKTEATGALHRFQVQIHQSSNLISVYYYENSASASGQGATIGFQGAGGATAHAYPLTFNGKILNDDIVHQSWSIAPTTSAAVMHALLSHSRDDVSSATWKNFGTFAGANDTKDVTLPFQVFVDGVAYKTLTISAKGWIELGANTVPDAATSDPSNVCLPTPRHQNPFIAAYWDAVAPFGTNVRYGSVGTDPNQTFLVDFSIGGSGGTEDDVGVQVQIHQGSNVIDVQYLQVGSSASGQSATIGFQGAGGADARAYGLGCNARILDHLRPDMGWSVAPSPECGNGIVETGEDCETGTGAQACCVGACCAPPAPPCGDGHTDPGEDCDRGSNNGLDDVCCTIDCRFAPGKVCRAPAGECDREELCPDDSDVCPVVDQKREGRCRVGPNNCFLEAVCDGRSNECPPSPFNDGPTCDADHDPCTDTDTCQQGECVPGERICSVVPPPSYQVDRTPQGKIRRKQKEILVSCFSVVDAKCAAQLFAGGEDRAVRASPTASGGALTTKGRVKVRAGRTGVMHLRLTPRARELLQGLASSSIEAEGRGEIKPKDPSHRSVPVRFSLPINF